MAERRLTVVQTLPALEAGGVEKGTLEIARGLVERGHRSIVVSAGGRLVRQLIAEGSEHVDLPVGRKSLATLRLIPRLRRYLDREGVDILHARSRVPAWVAYLAWRRMPPGRRPRFVTTVHGLYSVNRFSAVMTRGERVIAVSRATLGYILENYAVDPGRIEVIPRGIDRSRYPYGYRPSEDWLLEWYAALPQLRGARVLTLPGRITRLKGHHDLLAVVAELIAGGADVYGLIVGGEDPRRQGYAAELRRAVAERRLEQRIVFTGQRDDVREIFAVSDFVLSLSAKPESFGRTVLEALSLGVPVIGYDHGGVGEILDAVYPAGKVPQGDTEAVAARIRHLTGEAARVPETHAFDLETYVARTIELYHELVEEPRDT